MDKTELKHLIDVAAGRVPADAVIRGALIADVYNGTFREGDLAIVGGLIAGIATHYEGAVVYDAAGMYLLPAFIDSHIHVESSYVCPEELGRLLVPHGTATIISDPHEIVNVTGVAGLRYMIEAAHNTPLDIKYMLPSCVPATPFEHSGAVFDAEAMEKALSDDSLRRTILGIGEFMDFPAVIAAEDATLDKLLLAKKYRKVIDGHAPRVAGRNLNAYAAAGIRTDHECETAEEVTERLARGMYAELREGSACHDLRTLLKAVTPENARRCLLCSDDRQPKTIFEKGDIEDHLRICVEEGIPAMTALRMATLNAAECYELRDRGAIAPGLRADLTLVDSLTRFNVKKVWLGGALVAENGKYLPTTVRKDTTTVNGSFHVKEWTKHKLELRLKSDDVWVIDVKPRSIVTEKGRARVKRDDSGRFMYEAGSGIAKIAVIERHKATGNVATALIRGFGPQCGAIALSIAHDSHNIITVGMNDDDMFFAVNALRAQGGGIALANNGSIVERMPMPLAGIMSDQSGEWVDERLSAIHRAAYNVLGVNPDVDPVMTLCFMSLVLIPELKITDSGLFDVAAWKFINLEREASS